ncbi:hypothetical protein A9Q99_23995 [Gammaproteobacteria bacterium 45_16_T64]|nr:hypothetical protein A9Q99_23995 [Gammaproteobacteria bacterium 45_16_T64]
MLILDNTPILPANYMRIFLQVAEQMGASVSELLEGTGIDEQIFINPEVYITFGQYKKMKARALEVVKDPSFHFKYGTSINLTEHGKLGHAAFSSLTFEDALKKVIKYIKILNRMYHLDAEFQGDIVHLKLDTINPEKRFYVVEIEQIMSAMYHALSVLPQDHSNMLEVRFNYSAPKYRHIYHDYFGERCYFDCEDNEIVFNIKELKQFWTAGDQMIERIANKNCDDALQQLDDVEGLPGKIRDIIINSERGFPNQEMVAEELNMPLRSMARYLKKQHTSFQEIMDTVREELAIQYLETTQWCIDEIADLLGYSSAANFSRAFKKWTGLRPSEYRANHLPDSVAKIDSQTG